MSAREPPTRRTPSPSRHPLVRGLWVAAGFLFLGLGILGLFLPVVPTTPFLLAAAFCFYRGSERLHRWLLEHRLFGGILKDYLENRGLTIRTKALALTTLWVTILASCLWFVPTPLLWARIVMVAIALIVTVHLVRFKTR